MTRKNESIPATHDDPPRQTGNVAVNDRIASNGADFTRDDNASGEGNDASLAAGPSFVRQINPDGTVQAVPADADEDADADAPDADSAAATPGAEASSGRDA